MPNRPPPNAGPTTLADLPAMPPSDPIALFRDWLAAAEAGEPGDPTAMALATANAAGVPSVRIVLMKAVGPAGFDFYSNAESRKGAELAANPRAALGFHWKSLRRQVRVDGPVVAVPAAEADAYWRTRPRESQASTAASIQSRPLPEPGEWDRRLRLIEAEFAGRDIPRPAYWVGYRVVPQVIEFWQERPHRRHDRLVYRRSEPGAPWQTQRLFP